jgi:hypothetical protein
MRDLVIVSGLLWLLSQGVLAQRPPDRPAAAEQTPSQSKPASDRLSSTDILRTFRTIQIQTGTWLAKSEMCEGALQNHPEFDDWELSLVRVSGAVMVKIDHQPGWFYYQYSMVHAATGLVLLSGNVSAWDGNVACGKVADRIIERIKRVRPLPEKDENRKKDKKEKEKP